METENKTGSILVTTTDNESIELPVKYIKGMKSCKNGNCELLVKNVWKDAETSTTKLITLDSFEEIVSYIRIASENTPE